MSKQTNFGQGRPMRHESHHLLCGLLLAGALWSGGAVAAATLKTITYDTLPGGRVALHMNFAGGPVPTPKIFTTGTPPRIAIDFADTSNAAARHMDIGKGSTSGVSAVSAGDRTRVVVELMRDSSYVTRVDGDSLVLTVNNGNVDHASSNSVVATDPTKALPSTMGGPSVSNVDFRRGANGAGKILVDFSGPGAQASMHREGDDLVVDLSHVNLPPAQAQRLDVLDFATPVQSIVTRKSGGGAQMNIAIKGNVETSAYLAGSQYVVEVTPKKAAAATTKLGTDQAPVYAGHRVTFNFQDIPVRSALQLLADISGLNLVASDSVGGSVTLRLVNVPWDQALDVILRAKGLDKRRDGNVVWIAPQKELADYEQSIADARIKSEDNAPLTTAYIPISYGKAEDIAKLLTQGSLQSSSGGSGAGASGNQSRGFLSPRGSVSFDTRTNTLLLHDNADKIASLRKLIAVLDTPVKQVLIESRIVVATDSFTRELGAKFGAQGSIKNPSGQVISTGGTDLGNGTTSGLNVNLPASNPAGSFGLAILGANYALDLELSAAQTEGRGEVISSPRAIVANHQTADLQQGQEIGYVTYQNSATGAAGSGTATVQFKDAVLQLKVTPTITADNRVYMQINVKKDALNKYLTVPGSGQVPIIDTRSINTSALVYDGQTVVLGGIYEVTKQNTISKVPGLGDIPGIGALFRKTSRQNDKAELLIFVTPRILKDTRQW